MDKSRINDIKMYDLKKSTGPTNVLSLKSDKHMLVISFTVSKMVLRMWL